ncbi:ESPR domain-containing protein [Acinetobacter colistiniresistens]
MNKIYRLVWNKYLALWTVVSEIARGKRWSHMFEQLKAYL